MAIKFESFKDRFIAVELLDGSKVFGKIVKWSRSVVWIEIKNTDRIIDIPKEIAKRILVIF